MALFAFLAQATFADAIYDRDLVRGFLGFKGDFRSQKSNGVRLINEATSLNEATRKSYVKEYVDGHVEIGGEYNQLRTWFDIDFMPITPVRGTTEWYTWGLTWMWGYKLRAQNVHFNIIPSIGPGLAALNVRKGPTKKVMTDFGPALNLELEIRLQFSQFSAGLYGGYKVERHEGDSFGLDNYNDINTDKVFGGLKLSWTMLNNFQKKAREME